MVRQAHHGCSGTNGTWLIITILSASLTSENYIVDCLRLRLRSVTDKLSATFSLEYYVKDCLKEIPCVCCIRSSNLLLEVFAFGLENGFNVAFAI